MGNSNNKNVLWGLIIFNIIWFLTRKPIRNSKHFSIIIVGILLFLFVIAPIAIFFIFMM